MNYKETVLYYHLKTYIKPILINYLKWVDEEEEFIFELFDFTYNKFEIILLHDGDVVGYINDTLVFSYKIEL